MYGGEKERICCNSENEKKTHPKFPLHFPSGGALCSTVCKHGEVMSLVIRFAKFIDALNDRQFKSLLDENGNNYPGLLSHRT